MTENTGETEPQPEQDEQDEPKNSARCGCLYWVTREGKRTCEDCGRFLGWAPGRGPGGVTADIPTIGQNSPERKITFSTDPDAKNKLGKITDRDGNEVKGVSRIEITVSKKLNFNESIKFRPPGDCDIITPILIPGLQPIRQNLGITRPELAKLTGASREHIRKLELGKARVGNTLQKKLCSILCCDLGHLLTNWYLVEKETWRIIGDELKKSYAIKKACDILREVGL